MSKILYDIVAIGVDPAEKMQKLNPEDVCRRRIPQPGLLGPLGGHQRMRWQRHFVMRKLVNIDQLHIVRPRARDHLAHTRQRIRFVSGQDRLDLPPGHVGEQHERNPVESLGRTAEIVPELRTRRTAQPDPVHRLRQLPERRQDADRNTQHGRPMLPHRGRALRPQHLNPG
ncbi:hypothetical protein, partial [Amycolatopsis sp. NPDC000740]|uniref:hypothetical protein n=1 Tax=Amycolatopsis sp. NPDC000740 TaxID=3154269 RepID=UPI00332A684B